MTGNKRITTLTELINFINDIGFLPLFSNDIPGLSVEDHVSAHHWWTGNPETDPWVWREIISSSHQMAYGKFFDKRAGFISLDWLPVFVNYRRNGYDFDSRWEDGLASRREKKIMDALTGRDADGDMIFPDHQILSTDLKKTAGFGKNGEKNYQGIITGLQMQLYLVIADFHRRVSKKGVEYGMPVSVLLPPEAVWGYEMVTGKYDEEPVESWERIMRRVEELYPGSSEKEIVKVIGKKPE